MENHLSCDVLILGSGAAGQSLALKLPDHLAITIVAKADLSETNTRYAQGGISAVLGKDDSVDAHIKDTLRSGAGLCDEAIVRKTAEHAKDAILWLDELGVGFTKILTHKGREKFHLTKEGGHSHRRVVHADDATGLELENTLSFHLRQKTNIEILEHHNAIDLITQNKRCVGAYLLDLQGDNVSAVSARFVVLATGGACKAYLYTSNPDIATGDGIAMAYRAGCQIGNMEFIQFHPTCLYHPKAKSFLISEALRGEGAYLTLPNGERFMAKYDEREELAPRDIVARAIDHEMKRLGADCLYLDISHKDNEFITNHFPTIYKKCLEFGIDITQERIPVVPAAHYTGGGIVTDEDGKTDITNLYAIGEAACTGLHGANRMASNSLLECIVFSEFVNQDIRAMDTQVTTASVISAWDESQVTDSDEEVVVAHNWEELRRFMWDYVGIVRTNKRLQRAKHRVDLLAREIHEYYGHFRVTNDLLELRNLVVVADLIVRSALLRKESRGLHYTLDYTRTDPDQIKPTIISKNRADQANTLGKKK